MKSFRGVWCRRHADVWSHPGHYLVHPPTPPWSHKSISWSWMDDSHPFRSLSISHPIPDIKLFQTLTLELQGQGHGDSWVWSKGKVIQSAQYHINSLPFHFTSIRPTIPEIELFWNLTLKHPRSRSWVRAGVNSGIGIDTNSNSRNWNWKGIE